jgi:hypothetical protein
MAFIAIVAITFTVYLITLSPTVNSFDSGEIITGAYTLGIIHAPGYPLYLTLGHLVTHLPLGNPARNMNLMNAALGSFAIATLFLCCFKVTNDFISSAFTAFLAGFSNLYWDISVVTEVHTFNALLIGIVIYRLICFRAEPGDKNLNWLVFSYGLSLAHHIGVVLLSPFLLFVVLRTKFFRFTLKNIVRVVIIFFIPFLVYLYIPIRSIANPQVDYVRDYFQRDLTSLQGIFWMISGKMFSQEIFGKTFLEGLVTFSDLLTFLWINYFGIGIVLAIYGLWMLAKEKFDLAVFTGGGSLFVLLFFANYNVIDNNQMIIPALVLITLPMAFGLSSVLSKASSTFNNLSSFHLASIGVLLLLFFIFVNRPLVDRSRDWTAYRFATQVLEEVPPDSFIVSQWTAATPLLYAQVVEQRRPDVEIFDRGLFVLGERDKLGKNDPSLMSLLVTRVNKEILKRPTYITENDYGLNDYFCIVPEKSIYRMYPTSANRNDCVGD